MSPTNIANWSTNSYNIPVKGNSFCVKPGSMYTNKDANFNYFNVGSRNLNSQCGDPYTYYAYWYRRFPNQTKYLNCYFLPDKSVYFKNTYGYVKPEGNCNCVPKNRWNVSDNGFKYYDSAINYNPAPSPV